MDGFRPLDKRDKQVINALLIQAPWMKRYTASELVFENLYAWKQAESIEIAWCDDHALLRCVNNHQAVYMPPVAASCKVFVKAVKALLDSDPQAWIVGLTKPMKTLLKDLDVVLLEDDRLAEYLYRSKDMIELRGSKYHRKRNQFNQFEKTYAYRFDAYQNKDRQAVVDLLIRYQERGGNDEDHQPILGALDHLDELSVCADLLWVDDVVVALSIIAKSIFGHGVVMFEKADVDYSGSYTAIARMVADKHFVDITYITRQEDLGIPALRRAKQSYYPLRKEMKYVCFHDPIIKQMHALYLEAFDDPRPYVDHFFLYESKKVDMVIIEKEGKIVSGQHLIMTNLVFMNKVWPCPFVVGTATVKAHRREGHMRALMTKTVMSCRQKGFPLLALYPETIDVYHAMGFVPYVFEHAPQTQWPKADVRLEQTVDVNLLVSLYKQALEGKQGHMLRDADWYVRKMQAMTQLDLAYALVFDGNSLIGYVLHGNGVIEEWIPLHKVLPVVEGLDFSKHLLPGACKGKPGQMIRITDAELFFKHCRFDQQLTCDRRIKFVDDLLATSQNLHIKIQNGHASIEPCDTFEMTLNLSDLAKAVFWPDASHDLHALFKTDSLVSYDKY